MIRLLILITLLAGLFPAQAHNFVNVACDIALSIADAVGGRESLILIALVAVLLMYAGKNKKAG